MNFDGFMQILLEKRRLTDPAADIRDAFRLFDKDADGYLTLKDLQQVIGGRLLICDCRRSSETHFGSGTGPISRRIFLLLFVGTTLFKKA